MTIWIIARLTIQEAQRRRILWVGLLLGILFLAFFGLGFHYMYLDMERSGVSAEQIQFGARLMFTAGLYATNFLIVVITVITSVTALSGEIESHTVETLLTKPIRRWELVLGKWTGFALLLLCYILFLCGAMLLFVYWRAELVVANLGAGLALMVLQGLALLSLTLAGGTRLSSLANGVLAFMLYGIAFIGGWIEQIGAILRNETAVDIGIVASLIMPSEAVWKKALTFFLPETVGTLNQAGPFAVVSQPSPLMIWYAVAYALALLGLALWSFSRRDL